MASKSQKKGKTKPNKNKESSQINKHPCFCNCSIVNWQNIYHLLYTTYLLPIWVRFFGTCLQPPMKRGSVWHLAATEVMEVPTSPCAELLWNYDTRRPTFHPDRVTGPKEICGTTGKALEGLWIPFIATGIIHHILWHLWQRSPCSHGPKSSKIILMRL